MEPKTPSPPDQNSQGTPRKPYQKPRLQTYGDLSEITQARLGTKNNDGTGHPNKHFTS